MLGGLLVIEGLVLASWLIDYQGNKQREAHPSTALLINYHDGEMF